MGRYKEIFTKSVEDPEAFWGKAAEGIDWYKTWDKVIPIPHFTAGFPAAK